MITSKKLQHIAVAGATAIALAAAFPVFAETNGATAGANVGATANVTTTGTSASTSVKMTDKAQARAEAKAALEAKRNEQIKSRADAEIDRRVAGLQKQSAQINAMVKVSATQKTDLTTAINAQVTALQTLKAKIDGDTDQTTLKTDTKSITDSYRIYMLVMPETQITAAADRLLTIVDSLTTLSTKLQAKITEAQTAGKDVTSAQATLADFNAKAADAQAQAQAAISSLTGLTPDQGDKTKMAANDQALKDARAKLKTAEQDINAARQDAQKINKLGLTTGLKIKTATGSTTTTTAQ